MNRLDYVFLIGAATPIIIGILLAIFTDFVAPTSGVAVAFLDLIINVIGFLGYIGIFVLAFLDIVVPGFLGELFLPFVGFLVANKQLNYILCVLMASLGNVLGMFVIYLLSLHYGRLFIIKYGKYLLMDRRHIELTEELFNKYGEIAVMFGRILPVYRELVSVPAGLARMRVSKFFIFTFIGCFVWDAILIYTGSLLGEHYVIIKYWLDKLDIFIWISAIITIIWFIIKGRIEQQKG
ncbi:MAG: DedA family protein [Candidatus Njordarchaeales archaeon]